jgi:hypothetical protein
MHACELCKRPLAASYVGTVCPVCRQNYEAQFEPPSYADSQPLQPAARPVPQQPVAPPPMSSAAPATSVKSSKAGTVLLFTLLLALLLGVILYSRTTANQAVNNISWNPTTMQMLDADGKESGDVKLTEFNMVRTATSRGTRNFEYQYRLKMEMDKKVREVLYTISFMDSSGNLLGTASGKYDDVSLGSLTATGIVSLPAPPKSYEMTDFKTQSSFY